MSAGIPLYFGGDRGANMPTTRLSGFFKVNTLLTHDTALLDVDAGTVGYLRLTWSVAAYFAAEYAFRGTSGTLYLCPGGFTPEVDQWYWASIIAGGSGNGAGTWDIYGQVWGPAGVTPGLQHVTHSAPPSPDFTDLPNCGLGLGVPLSSIYNPFPDASGDEMTEVCVETNNGPTAVSLGVRSQPATPIAAPGSPTSTGIVALYHMNEPLGPDRVIHDATPNHYDLSPSPHNLVLADSPF